MFNSKKSNDKEKLKAIKKKLNSQKQKNITSKQKLTKQEKKEMKRKRKEFKSNKTKYEIEGGIGGDKDPRTKRDMRTTFIAIFAIVLFVFSSILCGFGFQSYANFKKIILKNLVALRLSLVLMQKLNLVRSGLTKIEK